MVNMLPQSSSSTTVPVAVLANRRNFLYSIAATVVNGLVRKEIQDANNDMRSLQTLLEEYLSIIPLDSKEAILTKYGRQVSFRYCTIRCSSRGNTDYK
jgi:hypothetical protein